jgi:hypothetical protein
MCIGRVCYVGTLTFLSTGTSFHVPVLLFLVIGGVSSLFRKASLNRYESDADLHKYTKKIPGCAFKGLNSSSVVWKII